MRKLPERAAALAAGRLYYETGKPCRNGHIAPRFVSTWRCRECNRQQNAKHTAQRLRALSGRDKPARCDVCREPGALVFDHDHASSKFRGWICGACNLALGHAKDSPQRLRALADYLENHHGQIDDARAQLAASLGLRRPQRQLPRTG